MSQRVEVRATRMRRETEEAPAIVARMLGVNRDALSALGQRLRAQPPAAVVTCARGSSDHAATYGKYLIEAFLGISVASAAPSTVTLLSAPVGAPNLLVAAVSQSGRSPDLLATVEAYRARGSSLVALVNDADSPLAALADLYLPLAAGPETSVAATKSCIASFAMFAAIVAEWSEDEALGAALRHLPDDLARAIDIDWAPARDAFADAQRMFVIGRGFGLALAQEAALKLKETCAIQAEPFSSAEVRHGPMAIVGEGFPILGFATSDRAGEDVLAIGDEFAGRGGGVFLAAPNDRGALSAIGTHPALEPILMLATFYSFAERLALDRGLDPDSPPYLAKVTRTL